MSYINNNYGNSVYAIEQHKKQKPINVPFIGNSNTLIGSYLNNFIPIRNLKGINYPSKPSY